RPGLALNEYQAGQRVKPGKSRQIVANGMRHARKADQTRSTEDTVYPTMRCNTSVVIARESGRSSNHGSFKYICDLCLLDAPLSRGMTSQRLGALVLRPTA